MQKKLTNLFRRINLDYPGLEKAKDAFLNGEFDLAADCVIAYYKSRKSPRYLFGKAEISLFTDTSVIAKAEEVMNHFMLGYPLGDDIDWRRNYDDVRNSDHEWVWSVARNLYWQPLARAYALTGNEKYAAEFVRQFTEFNDAWPVSEINGTLDKFGKRQDDVHCWRTIDSAIRVYCSWLPAMEYFRDSPSLNREFWVYYLNLLFEHAEFWYDYYSFHISCSNWISMEGVALLAVGILYPEFQRAPEWFKKGYARVTFEARQQFDLDGAHCERTPIYHLTAAGAFLQAYRLMAINGIETPPYMLPQLEKAGEFLMRLVKPDFTTPMIGDADRNDLSSDKADLSPYEGMNNTMDARDLNEPRAFYRELAELTGRQDFLFMATGGKAGAAPKPGCEILKEQGIYAFREGFGKDASWWMVSATQLERGESAVHSHYDIGHLEIQINGSDIIQDSGRYLYSRISDPRWRQYFYSARAHNTALVDDVKIGMQSEPLNGSRAVRTFLHGAGSGDGYEYVDISHNGYAMAEWPVFHRRRVVRLLPGAWIIVDDFTGIGEHDYKQFFNFAPKRLTKTDRYGGYRFEDGGVVCELYPVITDGVAFEYAHGSTNPFAGWVSYGYSMKEPAHNIAYFTRGSTPARMASAIVSSGSSVSAMTEGAKLIADVKTGGKAYTVTFDKDTFKVEKA